jgi:hypothetical protein
MFFSVDGGRSRIFGTASHGARRRYFLVLMVGALGSPAPPPRGPLSTFFTLMVDAPGSPAPPPRRPTVDVS